MTLAMGVGARSSPMQDDAVRRAGAFGVCGRRVTGWRWWVGGRICFSSWWDLPFLPLILFLMALRTSLSALSPGLGGAARRTLQGLGYVALPFLPPFSFVVAHSGRLGRLLSLLRSRGR